MENLRSMQLVDEVRDLPLTVSDVLAQVIRSATTPTPRCRASRGSWPPTRPSRRWCLKLANSAYYGYARRIESLPDAVVLLGFASVKNLAITASITRLLATDRDDLLRSAVRASSSTRWPPPSAPASSAAPAASRARRRSSPACCTTSA